MPPASRQLAFSRDNTDNEALFDALEQKAALPGGASVARYSASCMRKSRPAGGLHVGVLYQTRTHLVFCAHFVSNAPHEIRLTMPLRHIVHVRRAWSGRLLPHGLLLKCKGIPDHLVVLPTKEEQREVLTLISAAIADAKGGESSDSGSSQRASDLEADDFQFPESEPEPDSQPEVGQVQVKTLRRVKFAPVHQQVELHPQPVKTPFEPDKTDLQEHDMQKVLDNAVSRAHHKVERSRQQDSVIFFVSAFVLLFTTVGVCVALHMLQLRMSVIASRLAMQR